MKFFGKYECFENRKKKFYLVRKKVPKHSRRVIVWGPTGVGKSSVLIADAICSSKSVLYISSIPFDWEWESMRTEEKVSVYKDYKDVKGDFTGKAAYDFGRVPSVHQEAVFVKYVVPYLEFSGITSREDVTVILDSLVFLTRYKGFLDKITKNWKCKIVLDLTCGAVPFSDELPLSFASKKWKSVPVFTWVFKKHCK